MEEVSVSPGQAITTKALENKVVTLHQKVAVSDNSVTINRVADPVRFILEKKASMQGVAVSDLPELRDSDRFGVLDVLADERNKLREPSDPTKGAEKKSVTLSEHAQEAAELTRRTEVKARADLGQLVLSYKDLLLSDPRSVDPKILKEAMSALSQGRLDVQGLRRDAYDLARIAASQGASTLRAAGVADAEKTFIKQAEDDKKRREAFGIKPQSPEGLRKNCLPMYEHFKVQIEEKFGKIEDDTALKKTVGLIEVEHEDGSKTWEASPGSLLDSTIQAEDIFAAAGQSLKDNITELQNGNIDVAEAAVVAAEVQNASQSVVEYAWSAMVNRGMEAVYDDLIANAESAGDKIMMGELKTWHESTKPLMKMYMAIEQALPGFLLGMVKYMMDNEGQKSLGAGFLIALTSIMLCRAGAVGLNLARGNN